MNFMEFNSMVICENQIMKRKIREQYIKEFINVNHQYFYKDIKKLHKYHDGLCYDGYLWDYLKKGILISEDDLNKKLISMNNDFVYVMWDIHSEEKIFIENYWKFQKDDILKMNPEIFLKGESFLPEDIYIFDKDMTWTLIKTHEDIGEEERYCLMQQK